MAALRPFTLLDVFCERPLEGNGLAVVHGADGLDDATMARFALETRLSETSFLQQAVDRRADYRHRIWTLSGELPFAGHPSLGAAVAVALRERAGSRRYVQQTVAGLQPIDVELDIEAGTAQASMLQEPAVFGSELEPGEVLGAVGLGAGDAAAELPPQVVSTGVRHILAPLADAAALGRLRPDWRRLRTLLAACDAVVLYVAWLDVSGEFARARGFFLGAGLGADTAGLEDPATGSAAGPLCAYLAQRTGLRRLEICQGVEMGRPSRISCGIEREPGADRGWVVRVRGGVRILVDGTLRL